MDFLQYEVSSLFEPIVTLGHNLLITKYLTIRKKLLCYGTIYLPWLLSFPCAWVRELPEEDEFILDDHGDQACWTLAVSIWTGGNSKCSEDKTVKTSGTLSSSILTFFFHSQNWWNCHSQDEESVFLPECHL